MNNSVRLIVIATTALSIFLPAISLLDLITNAVVRKEQVQIFHPLRVAYVFAADEGSLRCTTGKLAASQDECPATDRCPPPQNNTVSDCVSEAASSSTVAGPDTTNNETASNSTVAGPDTTNNETARNHCLNNRFTLHTPQCTDSSSPGNATLTS